jgi:hypothetical protein
MIPQFLDVVRSKVSNQMDCGPASFPVFFNSHRSTQTSRRALSIMGKLMANRNALKAKALMFDRIA